VDNRWRLNWSSSFTGGKWYFGDKIFWKSC